MPERQEYLGDGVHASFDGYQIWLAVNYSDHKVVALEPGVYSRLQEYAEIVYGIRKREVGK